MRNLYLQKKEAVKERKLKSTDLTAELDSFATKISEFQMRTSALTEQLTCLKSERVVDPKAQAEELEAENVTFSLKDEASSLVDEIQKELNRREKG